MPTLLIGKCSTFGGPSDRGVRASEGLALFEPEDLVKPIAAGLFLTAQPQGTTGMARRLDPEAHYIACRWNYDAHPKAWLREIEVEVHFPSGVILMARPVDWGPEADTGRIADLSPSLAKHGRVQTDDIINVIIPARCACRS